MDQTQTGYVLTLSTDPPTMCQVEILKTDDEISPIEVEGRVFVGDAGHEVFVHYIHEDEEDQWFPGDQVMIESSDSSFDSRFSEVIKQKGLSIRNHSECVSG